MKSYFLFFLFLLLSIKSRAQNERNVWYFGYYAGVDFNSGTAVALSNGALATAEGTSSICDANGNLLFYTDGITVYNANHIPMPSGTGLNGGVSTTQSALILKKPNSTNIYTIFTLDQVTGSNGFQYSEVDMSLNGGLGDVTTINTLIYSPSCERISAVRHQNGIDYWIITQDPLNDFRVYLYNSSGISSTYVLSSFGSNTVISPQGALCANKSGTKIALAIGDGGIKIFDFDNTTGLISNPITLTSSTSYGVSFSPNEQFIYSTTFDLVLITSTLTQYNLLAGSEMDIQNSETIIHQASGNFAHGLLQIGPDHKIYVAEHNYSFGNTPSFLGVISNPNLPGINCNFNVNGVQLANTTYSNIGLPTYPNDYFVETNLYTICQGDSIELSHPNFNIFNWAIENNLSNILSTDSIFTVSPDSTTTYILHNGVDTVDFNVIVYNAISVNLGTDTCLAPGNNLVLDATQPNATYLWQDGSNDSIFTVTASGTYWVEISNGPCIFIDSISIQYEDINIQGDTLITCDSTVTLSLANTNSGNSGMGEWTYVAPPGGPKNVIFDPSTNVTNPLITVPELGEYIFFYTSSCGATDTHTVVFESQPPTLNINLTQACDFNINLIASNPIQNGRWTASGPTGETITIANPNIPNTTAIVSNYGEYIFTYTYDFCEASFSATIDVLSIKPQITNTQTQYICDKTIPLSAIVPGHIKQWSVVGPSIVTFDDFQSANTFATVTDYGDYTFFFSGCGGIDTFNVSFIKNAPTLNAPTYIHCGTEALVEVLYYEGNIGVWSYQAGSNKNITLTELDDHTLNINSDAYGQVDLTYTTCDTSTTVNIVFMCELEIPNVFTPNNDGLNNEFFISRLTSTYYNYSKFVVYDRWGVEVYTNGRYGLEGSWWNGKMAKHGEDLPAGVYYYVLELHNKINDLDETYKGSVHIFR